MIITSVGEHAETLELSYTPVENIKQYIHFGKQTGSLSKDYTNMSL